MSVMTLMKGNSNRITKWNVKEGFFVEEPNQNINFKNIALDITTLIGLTFIKGT